MTECCEDMAYHLENDCQLHEWWECPDVVVHKFAAGAGTRYAIPIHDGGSSAITIDFCPWCGKYLIGQATQTEEESSSPTD